MHSKELNDVVIASIGGLPGGGFLKTKTVREDLAASNVITNEMDDFKCAPPAGIGGFALRAHSPNSACTEGF